MAFNTFSQFPAFYMALNNYFPFTPDVGIYAGGYQGPLYPNPMSLILPSIDFNPLFFQNPVATDYEMKVINDVYEGIGVGNPGINYRNPGHLLGIIDTYGRMSYGLNVILGIRSLSTSFTFNPSVQIEIPLNIQSLDETTPTSISLSDIYPSFSETPDSYISNFVAGSLLINPRLSNLNPFVFNDVKYAPQTNPIDLFDLFGNISLPSYINLPEVFQGFIQDMYDFIQMNMALQANGSLSPVPISSIISQLPRLFPPEASFPDFESSIVEATAGVPTRFQHKIGSLNVADSLKLLTGSIDFHRLNNQTLEYRSLTELNCVINILPIQTISLLYSFLSSSPSLPLFFTDPFSHIVSDVSQQRYVVMYSITDIVFNILNLNNDKQVNINGSATYDYTGIIVPFDGGEFLPYISRQFIFSVSNTNKFTWDRAWFGLDEANNIITSTDQSLTHGITDRTFNFNQDIDLIPGNNCVRAKLLTQSVAFASSIENNLDDLSINLNISTSNLNISHVFTMEGRIS